MWRKALFTIVAILVLAGWLYFVRARGNLPPTVETPIVTGIDFSVETAPPLHPAPTLNTDIKQSAWIPDWDMAKGIDSLTKSAQYFDSVSPVWYYVVDKGIIQTKRAKADELKAVTDKHGIKLIPSVASFNSDDIRDILRDEVKLKVHIDFLISEVEKYDYDGLDIDYESFYFDDQQEFMYLLRQLYDYLDSKGKILSVAVVHKWTDNYIFRWLKQTREVQDWQELGQVVHELRIMSYDFTGYTSTYPGPVAPLDWLEATLRYAVTRVDRDKIMLGLPLYGYDGWSAHPEVPTPYLGMFANPGAERGQADSVTFAQLDFARAHQISNILEPSSQEQLLTYTDEGKTYQVFYPSRESTRLRIELAKKYGIKGVAYWRMGGEDIGVYQQL